MSELRRTGVERVSVERTGVERTSVERTGVERTGAERTGGERTGVERVSTERTGVAGTGVVAPETPIRLRSGRPGSLRLALVTLLLASLILGVVQLAVASFYDGSVFGTTAFTIVFWIWMAAGVLAWWRRPGNAIGALIVFGALAVFVGGLSNLQIDVLSVVSLACATTILAIAVHLLHAFPSGRLRGALSVGTVIAAYVVGSAMQIVLAVFAVLGELGAYAAFQSVQRWLGLLVMVVTAVVLVSRLRGADRRHRGVLLPLFLCGSLAVVLIPLTTIILLPLGFDRQVTGTIQLALSACLPIAFMIGVLAGGYSSTSELEALSSWLGATGAGRRSVAQALAGSLGDESLRVVYWAAERATYVDETGAAVRLPADGEWRTALEVSVESRLVGAIVYDSRIIADPDTVRRAGQVLAIAIDRERLTTELVASNEALLQSRLRIVATADRERSRIAQDLHDGLQVQLVLLALEAQQIGNAVTADVATSEAATDLRRRIDEAAADLRRLVHNVLPAALVERGLSAATEDLVDRLEIPASLVVDVIDDDLTPTTTYTAYVIVAEALTNAVKHSRASEVRVRVVRSGNRLFLEIADDGVGGASVDRGTGLKGLADRVDVLGGTFSVVSSPGSGTEVKVELPCE